MKIFLITLFVFFLFCSEHKNEILNPITVADFAKFVEATNYVTDAERLGRSYVQRSLLEFEVVNMVSWRNPDSGLIAQDNFPVTQVSYNDALAYCKWAGLKLPTYKNYWQMAHKDRKPVNAHSEAILPNSDVNVIGNVWDITLIENGSKVKLAGGSYLCDENSCNGTDISRRLFVDRESANSHVGFSVVLPD